MYENLINYNTRKITFSKKNILKWLSIIQMIEEIGHTNFIKFIDHYPIEGVYKDELFDEISLTNIIIE